MNRMLIACRLDAGGLTVARTYGTPTSCLYHVTRPGQTRAPSGLAERVSRLTG
jgi:hypothetical protein